jgi:uncharacterized protein YabE (DUF348 family)
MRSQPPTRLVQIAVFVIAGLALAAVYVASSAASAPKAPPGLRLVTQGPATSMPTPAVSTHAPPTPTAIPPATHASAIAFTLIDNGQTLALSSTAPTIGEALLQAGITLYLADQVSPPADSRLTPGLTVTIARSVTVAIEVDGGTVRTRVAPQTQFVADALAQAGVGLTGLDYTLPAAGEALPADGRIRVVRVAEHLIAESEEVPFETLYEPRPDWELDTVQVAQQGQIGSLERTVVVRYENGVEVGRTVTSETVTVPPVNHVIGYGTNIVIRTLDTPDGPVQYWRKIFVRVTAYSPSRSGTPPDAPWYGRTRTGKQLAKGMAAVDPTVIPLGTQMYVVGYGYVTAEDTGSRIQGKWLDLGYEDWNFEHWYGYTDVYLLAPAPPPEQISFILP